MTETIVSTLEYSDTYTSGPQELNVFAGFEVIYP